VRLDRFLDVTSRSTIALMPRTDIFPSPDGIPTELVGALYPKDAGPHDRLRAQPAARDKVVYIVEAKGGKGKNAHGHLPGAVALANTAIDAGFNACPLFYTWPNHEAFKQTVSAPNVLGLVLLTRDELPPFSRKKLDALVEGLRVAPRRAAPRRAARIAAERMLLAPEERSRDTRTHSRVARSLARLQSSRLPASA
jgi:hypothetical protein